MPRFRSYPISFGLRLMRHLALFTSDCQPALEDQTFKYQRIPWLCLGGITACLRLVTVSPRFQDLDMGDEWDEAKLKDVCVYLRGSIHLRAPPRWKAVFPAVW